MVQEDTQEDVSQPMFQYPVIHQIFDAQEARGNDCDDELPENSVSEHNPPIPGATDNTEGQYIATPSNCDTTDVTNTEGQYMEDMSEADNNTDDWADFDNV